MNKKVYILYPASKYTLPPTAKTKQMQELNRFLAKIEQRKRDRLTSQDPFQEAQELLEELAQEEIPQEEYFE